MERDSFDLNQGKQTSAISAKWPTFPCSLMSTWESFNSTCVICSELEDGVLHRVKEEWADELSCVTGVSVAKGQLVCCRHFNPHSSDPGHRLTKKNFPGIKLEFATPTFTRSLKRICEDKADDTSVGGSIEFGAFAGLPKSFRQRFVPQIPSLAPHLVRYHKYSKIQLLKALYRSEEQVREAQKPPVLNPWPPFPLNSIRHVLTIRLLGVALNPWMIFSMRLRCEARSHLKADVQKCRFERA